MARETVDCTECRRIMLPRVPGFSSFPVSHVKLDKEPCNTGPQALPYHAPCDRPAERRAENLEQLLDEVGSW